MRHLVIICTVVTIACFLLASSVTAQSTPGYHLLKTYKLGGEGGWDYLTFDNSTRYLYISRATHVVVIDVDTGKEVGEITDTPGVHGIALAPELGRGFTSNGREGTVSIFDLKSFKTLSKVKAGENPDAILYDPASKRVFTFNGRSKFNASGRQSRISMLVEGKLKGAKLTGYYETDFLSAGTTSNNNQSNSYTLRQRQFWGQAALSDGLSFTGGQMWSLVTETKKGMENRTEATPLTIDAQYTAGFSWARQYGFRVVKSFNNKAFLGFSIEGPQTTFGGHGFSNITTASTTNTAAGALITTSTVQNFVFGAAGTGGGLFNPTANYSFNRSPDFIVKAAFDPGWGHYEIFGVGSTFRDRAFPCAVVNAAHPCFINGSTKPSVVSAFNDSRLGGGVGANVRIPLIAKKLDFGVHGLFGDGIGRYGTASLPDATAHPDGTLSLVRGGQALATLELHPTSRWDIYVNAGGEYAARTAYPGYLVIKADGTSSFGAGGYGSRLFNNSGCSTETAPSNQFAPNSGTCNADTRLITEGTLGFWHRTYTGPYGKLQWGLQYSYLPRSSWSGNNGIAPKAIENMFFTSFRYYLP